MSKSEKLQIVYGGNKSMATTKATTKVESLNIYQKLANARLDFINKNVEKTGKNRHLSYMYYTLNDIVPPATEILAKYGLVAIIDVGENGEASIGKVTDGENEILFRIPFVMPKPILNKDGNPVNNPVQDLGSSLTYARRYMWLQIMDITEHDPVDGGDDIQKEKPTPKEDAKPATKKAPLNEKQKKEKVDEVINNKEEMCNKVTLEAIKKGLTQLKQLDEMPVEYIKSVINEINDAKGEITMVRANEILAEINDKIEGK